MGLTPGSVIKEGFITHHPDNYVSPISGAQSEIEVGVWNEEATAIKKIPNWSLTLNEAERVLNDYLLYRSVLSSNGIVLPDCYSIELLTQDIDAYSICVIEEYLPHPTIEGKLRDGDISLNTWCKLLEVSVKSSQNEEHLFIDLKPDNFIYLEDLDEVVLIDLLPPMLPNDSNLISNYFWEVYGDRGIEHMSLNFGTLQGQISKLLALIKLQKPLLYKSLAEETLFYLKGRIIPDVYNYLAEQYNRDFEDQAFLYSDNSPEEKLALLNRLLNV